MNVLRRPIPTKSFRVIFQNALPRFAAKVELSHTAGQEQIVMARPAKEPLPKVTPTLNESYPVLFHNR
jgi:hypothetical protein